MVEGLRERQPDQPAAVSPFLYVSGGADAVHGRTQNGLAVVAEKAGPNCRNLFVALPPLPWNALQQYAKQANVHLYSEADDVIHANQHYLAISVAKAGKRTIRMPREVALKEILAFGEDEFFEKGSQFEMDFADHTCRIFRVVH